jgi:transcriptional regulator with XRE-family HTH domain
MMTPVMRTPATVFSSQIRALRRARHWSRNDLVARLEEIGYLKPDGTPKIALPTLATMERSSTTRAQYALLEDVLAIACALDVSPLQLILPADPGEEIQITATVSAPTELVRRWFAGEAPLRRLLGLPQSAEDHLAWLSQLSPEELERLVAPEVGEASEQENDRPKGEDDDG